MKVQLCWNSWKNPSLSTLEALRQNKASVIDSPLSGVPPTSHWPAWCGPIGSTRRLHVVIVKAWVERWRQWAADDYNPWRETVVAAVQNVPDEHGRGHGGQQASRNVHVAGVGQVRVGPDPVEGHQPDDQDKAWRGAQRSKRFHENIISTLFLPNEQSKTKV